MKFLVINGPNINMLGVRQPEIYGHANYEALVKLVEDTCAKEGIDVSLFQSNHEGAIVDAIQEALNEYDGIIINPAAYTHTSIAILDALSAVSVPTVEVHISDVASREDFRQVSYIRDICIKTIAGEGIDGYRQAILCLKGYLEEVGK
ncbi:MAG: type II 3-dehydroquinate dehydratase [Oscillospiraceae bacterium]|nr:type II 3-dehydroquinate dehydratase [Oscillospiraceae bacterium]